MEENKKKKDRTIIKCKDCGFKYYDGDIHKCQSVRVIKVVSAEKEGEKETAVEEKTIEKKGFTKNRKESFKMWKDL
jgi:hypothetical protein